MKDRESFENLSAVLLCERIRFRFSLVDELTSMAETWYRLVDHVTGNTKWAQHGTVLADWYAEHANRQGCCF